MTVIFDARRHRLDGIVVISYSTNMMGPWHTSWYVERGLTRKATRVVTTDVIKGYSPGDVIEYDEITTHYAGGRIDIRGVPNEPWGLEYSLAVMHGEDWNALGDFLDRLSGEKVVPYESLIMLFEAQYGRKIRWAIR
tara:strand:- start:496 stop:906 length:411 start_codon:yes stop_codon:yes gene_type:complete